MAKTYTSTDRFYRLPSLESGESGEVSFQVVLEQTDLWIVASRDLRAEVLALVRDLRGQLKSYILLHPEFQASLVPVPVPESAPAIVRDMAEAARACGVGPMAAVAGAVAQHVAEAFIPDSPDMLVENGGDLYLRSTRERVVGLLAVPESGLRLGLRLAPGDFPLSLCSSSGVVGHSLSFGRSDIVTVRSKRAALADAAATALGNVLKQARDLGPMLDLARQLGPVGVDGVFAQCQGKVAAWGKMELVALET
jgi:hypothetical protein